jgi:transposase-like protein
LNSSSTSVLAATNARPSAAATVTAHASEHGTRGWGTVQLQVPRVRDGSFFPSLLEPRRRAERALVAVVQEAYVQGVSTRRVDDPVHSLAMQGISKSQVSRLCSE